MILKCEPSGIPKKLKEYNNFVLWKKEDRNGKKTKVPYQINSDRAKTSEPSTWTKYSEVEKIWKRGEFSGIGFCLSEGTPIGIDLDNYRCPAFPDVILPWAREIIEQIDSYTEVSPSGKGIRIFAYSDKLPQWGRKKGSIEIYESGRYLTVTGHHILGTPVDIMNRSKEIKSFHAQHFGESEINKGKANIAQTLKNTDYKDILQKAFDSKKGREIKDLYDGKYENYPSPSEADLAFCRHLAFWLENDAVAIDQVFRLSGLYRDKWDEKHHSSGDTYGQGTIKKALSRCLGVNMKVEQPEDMSKQEPPSKEVISKLASLSPLEYEKVRKEKAKALHVRQATLDTAVKAARMANNSDGFLFKEVNPWSEPIDPSTLLTDITVTIRRFIVCDEEVSHAAALWVAMTWFIDVVNVAPLAVITAPEKRCGKTLLLSLLKFLSRRPIIASNISPAAFFRSIDKWQPTLLIDEADSFMRDNEELRGVINSGHTRESAYVIRTVGDNHTPKRFSTWGAKVIAGIGHLPNTIMDRSITLSLRRKLPDEIVERLRDAEPGLFDELSAKLARFAEDYTEEVRQARPPLSHSLNDRAQDNWEPLLAIAMSAGNEWLQIGTKVALKLSGGEDVTQTIGTELLADIQEIFAEQNADRIWSEKLIEALCTDKEKPWATYSKGFPITPRKLADKLKTYGIRSKTIRIGSDTAKGYERNQFTEAFSRYVTPSASVTTSQIIPVEDLKEFQSVTQGYSVTLINQPESTLAKECDGVTVESKVNGDNANEITDMFPQVVNKEDLREVLI